MSTALPRPRAGNSTITTNDSQNAPWKKGNSFGTLAFFSYGAFWLSFVVIVLFPALGLGSAVDTASFSAYLFLWGVFTLALFPIALRSSKALGFVFGSLALLFFLLALGFGYNSNDLITIAGYWGIIVGASAVYTGAAQIYNESFGRALLPLGGASPIFQQIKKKD